MASKRVTPGRGKLRAEAEAQVARAPPETRPRQPVSPLLHELQVHQVELEMQNDELRRDQLELEAAHARYVDLYDFAPIGYVTLSPRGVVQEANLTGTVLLGVERGGLKGSSFSRFVAREEADRWHLFLAALVRHVSSPHLVDLALRRADGSVFDARLVCHRQVDGARVSEIRVALTDVSESSRVDRALHATRDRMAADERSASQERTAIEARLAAMGTLVAGVAHEINNPLTAALAGQGLALELARIARDLHLKGEELGERAEAHVLDEMIEALEDAQEGGQRVARIVQDLSAFGLPSTGRTRVKPIDLVEQAMRWWSPPVSQPATVRVENPGAPEVIASAGQIEQVIVHLLTNAGKATPVGREGEIVVRVGTSGTGMASIAVIDHGVGIPPDVLGHVFDPFFTTRAVGEGKGMGLGLSISHSIVTAHGGRLLVESQVGKGSTFRLELPAAPDEA